MLDKQRVEDILTDRPGNYYSTANEKERQIFRDWMTSALQREEITVDFEKVNGEFRSMTCTLNEAKLPPAVNKTTQKRLTLKYAQSGTATRTPGVVFVGIE